MKTKGKILLVSLCAALLVSAGAVGSLAFFTDTDTVTNDFTVGDIEISLDEAKTDENGIVIENADRVKTNEYRLIPNKTYTKDPTVHIEANSEDCYVFVTVDNGIAAIEATGATSIESQMAAKGWHKLGVKKGELDVYVYCTTTTEGHVDGTIVPKSATETDLVVFESFKIDGSNVVGSGYDGTSSDVKKIADYADAEIKITAYAVQSEGFDNAANAWANTFGAANANV